MEYGPLLNAYTINVYRIKFIPLPANYGTQKMNLKKRVRRTHVRAFGRSIDNTQAKEQKKKCIKITIQTVIINHSHNSFSSLQAQYSDQESVKRIR